MSLSIPYTFTGGAGNKAKASEVNANFQAIANKFTEGAGGIGDSDIAVGAGIKGTKISNTLGSRIPTDRIEPDAVDKDTLKDDASAGAPNAAVNSAAHIKDAIITNAKLVDATLLSGKGKILTYSKACDTLFGAASIADLVTRVSTYENSAAIAGRDKTSLVPLAVYLERGGGVPIGADVDLVPRLQTRAGDNVIYFGITNLGTTGVSETLSSYTLKFVYWSAA